MLHELKGISNPAGWKNLKKCCQMLWIFIILICTKRHQNKLSIQNQYGKKIICLKRQEWVFKRIMLTTATKGKDDKASRIFITNLWNDVKHL